MNKMTAINKYVEIPFKDPAQLSAVRDYFAKKQNIRGRAIRGLYFFLEGSPAEVPAFVERTGFEISHVHIDPNHPEFEKTKENLTKLATR